MKELKVGIVTCGSMHKQLEECLASLQGSFRIYPIIPSCTFSIKIDLIRHYLDRSTAENDVTLLAYGICHPQLLPLLAEYGDHVVKLEGNNCYEMFLGSEKYAEYHKKCYWMLNEPFFTKWKNELLTGFGAGAGNRGILIGDTFKKLVYLRFEKDDLSLDLVEVFARTVGLEYEIHLADTVNLKRLLEEALAFARSTRRAKAPKFSAYYPRDSEMRTMIENIGEVIYKVDINAKQFTFVSPQVKGILGYTQPEFLDIMNDYLRVPFYHEDDRQQVVAGRYKFLVKCLNEGMQEPYEAEYRAKHKDSSVLWVRESIYPSYSPEGIIESFVGKIVDITERKRTEEERERFLSEIKEMAQKQGMERDILDTIMENTGAQLAYFDPDFNFIRVNSAYAKGSRHAIDELIGRNHFDLFPNEENQAIFEMVRNTGKPVEFHDKPFEYKDQPWRGITYWDWTLVPVQDASGRVQGLVLSLMDTTERKKLDQLKDEFIGLVSHELRSPLTVITGAVNTVLTEGERLSTEETRQLLQDAAWEADSLSHLLGNLLELSRVQADRLFLHIAPISVKNVLQGTVEKVRRQSSVHQFLLDLPKELPSVYADQLRLERILYNLLENAVKYSPKGSKIQVSVKPQEDYLVFCISDQGIGISPADQDKLFGPFQRLENSQVDAVKGAGLGLLVCRRLVEAHEGQIWVESEPGRGSTFFFTLPLSRR